VGQKINANQIHFEMHPIYDDKCITKRTVHIWCKKMLVGQKFVSYTEVQSVVLNNTTTHNHKFALKN